MDEYLMISGLQHFAFCRRQWALIHIENQWSENLLTIKGLLMHEKAHSEQTEKRGSKIITRGLRVCSHQLKITGICDVVEFDEDPEGIFLYGHEGTYNVTPVEYKRGRPKEHDADDLQLCAQAICLEEMLCCEITKGYLYYGENRRRTEVTFSVTLRKRAKSLFAEMHDLYSRGYTPKTKPTPKCKSCSLSDICLPVIQKNRNLSAREYIDRTLFSSGGVS